MEKLNLDKIDDWLERFASYALVQEIQHDVKEESKAAFHRALLTSTMGPEAYRLAKNHLLPVKIATATTEQIAKVIREKLKAPEDTLREGLELADMRQRAEESDIVWMARVKEKAGKAGFGAQFDVQVRNTFVYGLKSEKKRKHVTHKLEGTADSARALEVALKFASDDILPVNHVNYTTQKKQPRYTTANKQESSKKPVKCFVCGVEGHMRKNCRKPCPICKKTGHSEERCYQKNRSQGNQIHSVYGLDPGAKVNLCVEKVNLEFDLDTGASVSTIPEDLFKEHFGEFEKGVQSVKCANGTLATVLGTRSLSCQHGERQVSVCFRVMKGSFPCLLGRDAMDSLFGAWKERITEVYAVETDTFVQEITKSPVFNEGLGLATVEARLNLKHDVRPRRIKARNVPFAVRQKVDEAIQGMIKDDVIESVESSEWVSPIVAVAKQDGSIRVCGDFKNTLNPALDSHSYPLPTIEECFAVHAGAQYFTKLDISKAYNTIPLHPDDQLLTTIATPQGLFKWKRLPFGIATASSIFQNMMDNVLRGCVRTCVRVDDILISGTDLCTHNENVCSVIRALETAGLRCNSQKSSFRVKSVTYLGHEISVSGVRPLRDKVVHIRDCKYPENRDELISFLGLINYYSRYLPNLSTILEPLNRLRVKSVEWRFGEAEKAAMDTVKQRLIERPLLSLYDQKCDVILDCDASSYAVGAVLSIIKDGKECPVEFVSKTLSPAERRYAQIDREAYAIIWAVKRLSVYLRGRKFRIRTDHQPLRQLFSPTASFSPMATSRRQRWALFLTEFDYDICFRGTKEHANADFFSRYPIPPGAVDPEGEGDSEVSEEDQDYVCFLSESSPIQLVSVAEETEKDPVLKRVVEGMLHGFPPKPGDDLKPYVSILHELSVVKGVVKRGIQTVIPETMRCWVLEQLHMIHLGINSTKSLARGLVWWPKLDRDIVGMIKACSECAVQRPLPQLETHPWKCAERPGERIHIDLAGPFLGMQFLVLVDSYSRWLEVEVVEDITAETIVSHLRGIFARIGIPEMLVSDNGPQFNSSLFTSFLTANGVRYVPTATYSPWSNGAAEVCVRIFKTHLKKLSANKNNIRDILPQFLLNYRATPHTVTGVPPSVRMMGRSLRTVLEASLQAAGERGGRALDESSKWYEGQRVLAFNVKAGKWETGRVMQSSSGPTVRILQNGLIKLRHTRHLTAAPGRASK